MDALLWSDGAEVKVGDRVYSKINGVGAVVMVMPGHPARVRFAYKNGNSDSFQVTDRLDSAWKQVNEQASNSRTTAPRTAMSVGAKVAVGAGVVGGLGLLVALMVKLLRK